MAKAKKELNKNNGGANLGFEAKLWATADKLRGNMEPSDYKHVALGLIFLKYIFDAFEAKRAELLADALADPEDPEEYLAENVFWVPKEARWSHLRDNAKQPTIGKIVDDAMLAIEAKNALLKGGAAQGVRPAGAEQDHAGRADRFDQRYRHAQLQVLRQLDISFELVLLSAVWMHVAPKDRELAIQRIAELMNSSGLAVFTLRHGSAPPDRSLHFVLADELIKLAAAVDMTPVRVTDCGDQLQRSGVFWQTVVLCRS